MRRDHLLAVNARLSLPLNPINNVGSHGGSPEGASGHNRSPRINNYLPPDSSTPKQVRHLEVDLWLTII